MKCFRIYTEDVDRETILKEAVKRFPDGFTFISGQGCWAGIKEDCLVIEIIREEHALHTIRRFAEDVKRLNKQEAVYLTATDLTTAALV